MKTAKPKSKRIKVSATPATLLASRDDAEAAMNDLVSTQNNQRKVQAQLDDEILRIKKFYEPNLVLCAQVIQEKTVALQAWAEANPSEFPKDRKSIQFASGKLGFHTGTPKLALLNRRWCWETATNAVKAFLPAFIRDKPEIDKEAIIAQRADPDLAEALPNCGIKIVQCESFYIEPALADTDARKVAKSEAA